MEATLKTIVFYCFWHLLIIHYCSTVLLFFVLGSFLSVLTITWVCFKIFILLFSPKKLKNISWQPDHIIIKASWGKQANTSNLINWDSKNRAFLTNARSMYNLYPIRYSEAQPENVWAQLIQMIPECVTHSKHQTSFRTQSLHSGKKKKESNAETQNMCIFCLHCMISVKKKKDLYCT